MNRPFQWFVAILLMLVALLSGCSAQQVQVQRVTASTFASAANAAGTVLAAAYREEGLTVIAKAQTRAEAEAGLGQVRARWAPVWEQWEHVRQAQDAWATLLESDASIDQVNHAATQVKNTYCVLADLAKPLSPLPAAPGVTCQAVP